MPSPRKRSLPKNWHIGSRAGSSRSTGGITAWQALFEVAQLRAGQKVLIHAAAGGVGNFAVQFAKATGAYVIGTASSRNQAFLVELEWIKQSITRRRVLKTWCMKRTWSWIQLAATPGALVQALKKGGILVSIVQPPSQELATKTEFGAVLWRASQFIQPG